MESSSKQTCSSFSDNLDLLEVLGGCMENQDDVQELVAGLMETENELKSMTDDTSFLQFPNILQEIFPLDGGSSPRNEDLPTIAPSVSSEYLCSTATQQYEMPTQPGVVTKFDHHTISSHPLLPVVIRILQRRAKDVQDGNPSSELKWDPRSSSAIDEFMGHTLSLATQLSEDATVGNLMNSIDNEGRCFTGEMSAFCQNLLLKPDPTPNIKVQSSKNSERSTSQNKTEDKVLKENKTKAKPKTKSGEVKKQVRLSYRSTQILREWLIEHADNPFPTDSEKDMLCLRTGLTLAKLNVWFVNSRKRILAPLGLRNYHKEIAEFNKK